MFTFTREERLVLIAFACILAAGVTLRYASKQNPGLWNLINFVNSNQLTRRVDLNTASYEELLRVPYIGPVTAERIIAYREKHGLFTDTTELKRITGIGDGRYTIMEPHVTVSPPRRR